MSVVTNFNRQSYASVVDYKGDIVEVPFDEPRMHGAVILTNEVSSDWRDNPTIYNPDNFIVENIDKGVQVTIKAYDYFFNTGSFATNGGGVNFVNSMTTPQNGEWWYYSFFLEIDRQLSTGEYFTLVSGDANIFRVYPNDIEPNTRVRVVLIANYKIEKNFMKGFLLVPHNNYSNDLVVKFDTFNVSKVDASMKPTVAFDDYFLVSNQISSDVATSNENVERVVYSYIDPSFETITPNGVLLERSSTLNNQTTLADILTYDFDLLAYFGCSFDILPTETPTDNQCLLAVKDATDNEVFSIKTAAEFGFADGVFTIPFDDLTQNQRVRVYVKATNTKAYVVLDDVKYDFDHNYAFSAQPVTMRLGADFEGNHLNGVYDDLVIF